MDVQEHVAALEHEGALLIDADGAAGLDAPVPSCPGWRVRDLLAHIGYVHRWAARYVATALTDMVDEPDEATILSSAPPDDVRGAWVAEGLAALVGALRAAPAELECWTFLEAPSSLAMWARRQAHETAIHRVDAELAAGGPEAVTPFDAGFAADGVDELLHCFFSRRGDGLVDAPAGSLAVGLEATDGPGRWRLRLAGDAMVATPGDLAGGDACDVVVRAPAGDLYRVLWHRRPLEGLDVEGDGDAFVRAWSDQGVTWA